MVVPAIVPRWEWRTFGVSFGEAEEHLAAHAPEHVEESDDLYLLSVGGGDTVKVRNGDLDLKHLEQVNADGLEQWLPVLKAAFPIAAREVGSVLEGLRAPVPSLTRTTYTLEQLVDELVRPSGDLLVVDVYKRRRRYTIDGCMAELTDVRTGSTATRTIAVESEDPDRVLSTVRKLGLGALPNVNFPRGLKALLGFGTRYAVVDVGTNSVKFLLAERTPAGEWRSVDDRAEVTRLGEGLQETGRLASEPMARTVEAIAAMVDEATSSDAVAIALVGTAGLRIARNSSEFMDAVEARSGVRVEIITAEDEGRLAYLAVKSGLGPVSGSLVVFDTGGGSSQFTFGHGQSVDERFSVNVGAARFTDQFGLDGRVSERALTAALDAVAVDLERLDGRPAPKTLVGMGGAVTTLAAVRHELAVYDPDVVRGTVIERVEVDRQIELYRTRTADERRRIVGLQPKRAEVILAGACIVRTVMAKLERESLTVSDRGLRHGLLVERFG